MTEEFEKDTEENFPISLTEHIPIQTPDFDMSSKNTTEEIVDNDLIQANNTLRTIHHLWPHIDTIDKACKMSLTTMSLLTSRRKLLLKPASYAEATAQPKKNYGFEPIE
jgi:hypothetical protein